MAVIQPEKTAAGIRWKISGTMVQACNCDWGCPCEFNSRPTEGHCHGTWSWHVKEGHFGSTPLDGIHFAAACKWPGAIHEGNGECLPILDKRANESQIQALASLLGIAVVLETSATAFTVLKLAGAAYLAYLGIRTLLLGRRSAEPASVARLDDRTAFQQGVLGNLLNPKAAVIFVTVLPQFIEPGDSTVRLVLMLIAYEAMLVPWLSLYGKVISRAGRSRAGARVRGWLNRVTGVVLIGLGVRLAVERR